MAVKTLYVLTTTAVTPNFWGNMQEGGSAPAGATTAYGWSVGKSSTAFWPARLGASGAVASTIASATSLIDSTTGPTKGSNATAATPGAGDSFVAGPYTGTFAATAWQFDWNMRTGVAGAIGRLRMRVWKSANADGSSATALTASTQVGATITLSTSADQNTSMTWSPGSITLTNEYLFFQLEWNVTTAGTSNTDSSMFRQGTALITTPDFSASGVTVIFTPYRTKHRIRR